MVKLECILAGILASCYVFICGTVLLMLLDMTLSVWTDFRLVGFIRSIFS